MKKKEALSPYDLVKFEVEIYFTNNCSWSRRRRGRLSSATWSRSNTYEIKLRKDDSREQEDEFKGGKVEVTVGKR